MTREQLDSMPQLLTVAEVQDFLRIGRTQAYQIARIHGIRISPRAIRIPKASVLRILHSESPFESASSTAPALV